MFSHLVTPLSVAALAVTSVFPLVSCGPTAPHDIFSRTPAAGIDVKSLAPQLSAKTKIYLPGSTEFTTYTVRWSNLEAPTPNVVIAPGTEKDVQQIVCYPEPNIIATITEDAHKVKFASDRNIPFLAYNGHHGTLTTLGRMDYGIEIYLPQLNTVSIAKDKKSVTLGGGMNSKNVTDALWAAGKQTGTFHASLVVTQL
jgi:FAD/FMN-containing dehydrogenase